MTRILWIFQALFLGAKLKHSSTWSDFGAFVAVMAPLLVILGKVAVGYGWFPVELTKEEIDSIAQWIWQGSGIILAYWFRATSTEVGFGKEQEIGYQVIEPDEEFSGSSPSGVLYDIPGMHMRANSETDVHPGDDPGLDSFNR